MVAVWSDVEVFKLVEIWGEEEIQALLEGCTRNKQVYEKIAREMVEAGYDRTVSSEKSWRATADAKKSSRIEKPP